MNSIETQRKLAHKNFNTCLWPGRMNFGWTDQQFKFSSEKEQSGKSAHQSDFNYEIQLALHSPRPAGKGDAHS